ncbi:MAG: Glu/Leu/Phe/Val dehydrogenase [Planctomycetes bacterium]|nr:Glu/Leu/Phe/Val dehydrogenase [Planctomycetota bacterium]
MGVHILDAMSREGFEEVVALHDRRSNLRAFLAIHDTSRGPAFGGVRRWAYYDEDQALRDVLRLARAMTYKSALAELDAGGAKLVILDRPDLDVEAGYRFLGDAIERMSGRFYTGPDVGTGAHELGCLAERTRFATDPGPNGPGELAESTVAGVVAGMEAALQLLDGAVDWPRRTVVVQGLGEVGAGVARRLVAAGAKVLAAELDAERAASVAAELEVELVDPSREYDPPCDVFAPCALGGILHDLTLTRLHCRVVAGGANNVLARPLHGDRLHELGILYVPDFVINAGALIRGATFHLTGERESVDSIGRRVGRIASEILKLAAEEGAPPARVAVREAERRIEARRRGPHRVDR